MTDKELRKLTREDLLELLLEQAEAEEKRRGETESLTALNQSLESEKDRLTQELDACRAELEISGKTADALQRELDGAKDAAAETESLRTELAKAKEAEQEAASLREELARVKETAAQQTKQYQTELEQAGKAAAKAARQTETLRAALAETKQPDDTAEQLETYRAENARLKEENDSLRQELECLHQEGWQSSEKDRQFLADLVAAGKRFQQRAEELERENDRLRGIIRV